MLRRWILAILSIFLVIEVILLFPTDLRRDSQPESQDLSFDSATDSDQVMKGVHLVEAGDREKEWELWSDEAKSLREKDLWDLTVVKVIFFSEDGNEFTVTGKKGFVNVVSKDLRIFGNVVMVSSNGYQFFSEEAVYKAGTRLLNAPFAVEMRGPPDEKGQVMDLVGDRMDADLNKSIMNVEGHVKANQILEDGKVAKIGSDKAQFYGDSRRAQFFNNVVIDYDTMRITGPSAEFFYDQEAKQMKSLFVDGGARLSDDSKWATSQQLSVLFAKREYRLKGEPRVIQNDDELVGSEIIFLNGGEQMIVRSGEALVDEQRAQTQ